MTGTRKDVASLLLLSERRVTELTDAGVIPKPKGRGQYDLTACTQGYIKFLKSESGGLRDERKRYAKLKADLLDLKCQERTGELVKRSAVEKEAFRLGRSIRDKMQNVPARLAGLIAALSPGCNQEQIHALLTKEIHNCLEGLAGSDDNKAKAKERD